MVSLVADNLFDLLVAKMAPVYTSKKMKIEVKGSRFELGDFIVKLGSVTMAQNFKGILVEVEYRPCVMAEACWELLMEFVQGIFGHNAVSTVPRTLQPRMKEIYTPLDTMHQYMDQFSAFRKSAGIR
jgi:mediator of RNA polymerase II transcription subunit 20